MKKKIDVLGQNMVEDLIKEVFGIDIMDDDFDLEDLGLLPGDLSADSLISSFDDTCECGSDECTPLLLEDVEQFVKRKQRVS